jgi:hypothetical protein
MSPSYNNIEQQQEQYSAWIKCPDGSLLRMTCLSEWSAGMVYFRLLRFIAEEHKVQERSAIVLKQIGGARRTIESEAEFVQSFDMHGGVVLYEYFVCPVKARAGLIEDDTVSLQLKRTLHFLREGAWLHDFENDVQRRRSVSLLQELQTEVRGLIADWSLPLADDNDTLYAPSPVEEIPSYEPLGTWVSRMKQEQETEHLLAYSDDCNVKRVKAVVSPLVPKKHTSLITQMLKPASPTPPLKPMSLRPFKPIFGPSLSRPVGSSSSSSIPTPPPPPPVAKSTPSVPRTSQPDTPEDVEMVIHYPKLRPSKATPLTQVQKKVARIHTKNNLALILEDIINDAVAEYEIIKADALASRASTTEEGFELL